TRSKRDWSSDVCSSDLQGSGEGPAQDDQDKADEDQAGVENEPDQDAEAEPTEDPDNPEQLPQVTPPGTELSYGDSMIVQVPVGRSEERRVGKGARARMA